MRRLEALCFQCLWCYTAAHFVTHWQQQVDLVEPISRILQNIECRHFVNSLLSTKSVDVTGMRSDAVLLLAKKSLHMWNGTPLCTPVAHAFCCL